MPPLFSMVRKLRLFRNSLTQQKAQRFRLQSNVTLTAYLSLSCSIMLIFGGRFAHLNGTVERVLFSAMASENSRGATHHKSCVEEDFSF